MSDAPQAPTITSGADATFTVGAAGSYTLTTVGNPAASLSENGTLPTGVTFSDNGDGTGTLAGTPAVGSGGVYDFSITASNGVSPDATQSFTLTVDEAPSITSGDAATFTAGTNGTFTVTTSGYPVAAITESGNLATGVSLTDNGDGTATISGTPAAGTGGAYVVTVGASNGVSPDASQSFTLTVNEAPSITSGASTTFTVGTNGSFTVTSTGFPTAALSETGSLPSGVTFADNADGTGTLSGSPATGTGGVYVVHLHANNGIGTAAAQTFTLTVDEPAGLTSGSSTTFKVGKAGTFTVTTSGYPAGAITENGDLPAGVTFTDNGDGTATLAGTAAAHSGGVYPITFSADNGVGGAANQSFSLTVDEAPYFTSAELGDVLPEAAEWLPGHGGRIPGADVKQHHRVGHAAQGDDVLPRDHHRDAEEEGHVPGPSDRLERYQSERDPDLHDHRRWVRDYDDVAPASDRGHAVQHPAAGPGRCDALQVGGRWIASEWADPVEAWPAVRDGARQRCRRETSRSTSRRRITAHPCKRRRRPSP